MVDLFIKWMLTMPFYMALSLKKCIHDNLLVLLLLNFHHMFIGWRKPFILSSKYLGHGITPFEILCSLMVFPTLNQALLFSFAKLEISLPIFLFMSTIFYSHSTFLDTSMHALAITFSLKDIGVPNYFLGLELIPTSTSLFLSQ